jgi:hypothetical protein
MEKSEAEAYIKYKERSEQDASRRKEVGKWFKPAPKKKISSTKVK